MPLPRLSRNSEDYMKMVVFKCLTSMASSCFENWDIDDDEFRSRASMSLKTSSIVHPGAIGAVVELLPSLWDDDETDSETDDESSMTLPKVFALTFLLLLTSIIF